MKMLDSKISTASVHQKIKEAKSITDVLELKNNMCEITLKDYLNRMLYEKGLIVADVVRGSGVKKQYVHQIFNGDRKHPSRDVLLAIAFGLHLDETETQRMLSLGGCSKLYAKDSRDAIIIFCLENGYSLSKTDDILYENDRPTISPQN